MLKNRLRFLGIILLFTFSVQLATGCVDNKQNDYTKYENNYVLEGKVNVTSYQIVETVEALQELQTTKKNFLLYLGDPECGACSLFTPIYTQFAIENNLVLYYIRPSTALRESKIFTYEYTPSLIPFQNGEPVIVVDPNDDAEPFENAANLKKFVENFFTLPILLEVNEEQLDELIAADTKFIIYYFWKLCTDCAAVKVNVIDNYQIENPDVDNFYFIEVDQYRNNDVGGSNGQLWVDFTAKYQFNDYLKGKVPTFQYRNGNTVLDTAVYYNDSLETVKDGTAVIGIKVTGSFYEDAPFIGQTYTDRTAMLAAITPFHNQKLIAFLDRNTQLIG